MYFMDILIFVVCFFLYTNSTRIHISKIRVCITISSWNLCNDIEER